jgi:hypothetical protein
MMKNHRPYSNENGWEDASLITDRPKEEMDVAMQWIAENIRPRKTPLHERTSYGIKHLLQRDTGLYLTNNEFKDAMLLSGYEPVDPNELNWCYCISKKSPAFEWERWQR